jgi:hypothetical protein
MKKAIFAVLLLLATTGRAGAQGVDSTCLVLWQDSPLFPGPGYGWQNTDSVKVDICQGPQYLSEFARNKFVAAFQYFIMPHYDTIARTWMQIDTQYSNIRDGFDTIEQRLGSFKIQLYGYDPDTTPNDPGDTSDFGDKLWFVNFEKYVNVDTAIFYLSQLPELNFNLGPDFAGRPIFYEGVNKITPPNPIHLWPQPCSSSLFIEGQEYSEKILAYDALGRQLALPTLGQSNGIISIDVSKQPNGIVYIYALGQFFKILIQR